MLTAGAYREQVWDELARRCACAYPLPPHGHCPNFTHARKAAAQLLAHPQVAALHTLIVGPERALYPLRTLALKDDEGRRVERTPAMAAGLADHVWSMAEWLSFPAVQRR